MTTINLHQDQQREEMLNNSSKLNFSIVVFVLVFSIIVVSYVGLKIGISIISKKDLALQDQIKITTEESLNGNKRIDDVIDLQARLAEIGANLETKKVVDVNSILDKVAKNVIPGIFFSSYTDTDKKILITMRASNFDSVSKQVYNFKQVADFAMVEVRSLDRDAKGIKCDVEINIK